MTTQKYLQRKIQRVNEFFFRYQEVLKKDTHLWQLLEQYQKDFQHTQKVYTRVGVDQICAACGRTKKVCCGLGMELYCEDVLLLLNLLLGFRFPEKRLKEHWCFFLKEDGCSLLIRPLLCRNYFCDELQESLSHNDLVSLQEALGPEAESLFALLEYTKTLCPGI